MMTRIDTDSLADLPQQRSQRNERRKDKACHEDSHAYRSFHRKIFGIIIDDVVDQRNGHYKRSPQNIKILPDQQQGNLSAGSTIHLTQGYLPISLANIIERQSEQSETGHTDSQSGKGDVDTRRPLIIVIQLFYLIFYKRIFKLPSPSTSL